MRTSWWVFLHPKQAAAQLNERIITAKTLGTLLVERETMIRRLADTVREYSVRQFTQSSVSKDLAAIVKMHSDP